MGHVAAYDQIADWYEEEFLGDQSAPCIGPYPSVCTPSSTPG
jgi:hypothetical protein